MTNKLNEKSVSEYKIKVVTTFLVTQYIAFKRVKGFFGLGMRWKLLGRALSPKLAQEMIDYDKKMSKESD